MGLHLNIFTEFKNWNKNVNAILKLPIYTVKWCETLRTSKRKLHAWHIVYLSLASLSGVIIAHFISSFFQHYSPGILCPKPTSSSHTHACRYIRNIRNDNYYYSTCDADVMYCTIVYVGLANCWDMYCILHSYICTLDCVLIIIIIIIIYICTLYLNLFTSLWEIQSQICSSSVFNAYCYSPSFMCRLLSITIIVAHSPCLQLYNQLFISLKILQHMGTD